MLIEVISTFCPETLLQAIAMYFVGKSNDTVFPDANDNGGGGLKDVEEEAEAEEEAAEDQHQVRGDDADEDDDDGSEDEDDAKATAAAAKEVAPVLPIEEDPMAHIVIRHIIKLESEAEIVSTELWQEGLGVVQQKFSLYLLHLLGERKGLLQQWLACNRACFVLADIAKVKSASKSLLALLASSKKDVVECAKASAASSGVKHLVTNLKW